jgi:hypothetical protein
VIAERAQVADMYPLAPAQLGILFKSLDGDEPGVYVTQFVCRVEGDLDVDSWTSRFKSSGATPWFPSHCMTGASRSRRRSPRGSRRT